MLQMKMDSEFCPREYLDGIKLETLLQGKTRGTKQRQQ